MSARTAKYMYRSSGAGASGDISVEYGTDLGALTRLEVCNFDSFHNFKSNFTQMPTTFTKQHSSIVSNDNDLMMELDIST